MPMRLVVSFTLHKTQVRTVTHLQSHNWQVAEPELLVLARIEREPLAPPDAACPPSLRGGLMGQRI